jgi:hypothetical protein
MVQLFKKTNEDQYSLTFGASLDLKNPNATNVSKHAIEFGFEFQQRIERFYGVNPIGLWDNSTSACQQTYFNT